MILVVATVGGVSKRQYLRDQLSSSINLRLALPGTDKSHANSKGQREQTEVPSSQGERLGLPPFQMRHKHLSEKIATDLCTWPPAVGFSLSPLGHSRSPARPERTQRPKTPPTQTDCSLATLELTSFDSTLLHSTTSLDSTRLLSAASDVSKNNFWVELLGGTQPASHKSNLAHRHISSRYLRFSILVFHRGPMP